MNVGRERDRETAACELQPSLPTLRLPKGAATSAGFQTWSAFARADALVVCNVSTGVCCLSLRWRCQKYQRLQPGSVVGTVRMKRSGSGALRAAVTLGREQDPNPRMLPKSYQKPSVAL